MRKAIKGSVVALALVSVLLGAIIGYAIGSGTDDNQQREESTGQSSTEQAVPAAASEFRQSLQAELQEHTSLLTTALTRAYDLEPDDEKTQAALAQLDRNSVSIANVIGDVEPELETEFLSQWREHINHYAAYTVALKDNDQAAQDGARTNVMNNASQTASLLGDYLSDIDSDSVQSALEAHQQLVMDAMTSYAAGDYTAYHMKQTEAFAQSQRVTDLLYESIREQLTSPLDAS